MCKVGRLRSFHQCDKILFWTISAESYKSSKTLEPSSSAHLPDLRNCNNFMASPWQRPECAYYNIEGNVKYRQYFSMKSIFITIYVIWCINLSISLKVFPYRPPYRLASRLCCQSRSPPTRIPLDEIKQKLEKLGVSTKGVYDRIDLESMLASAVKERENQRKEADRRKHRDHLIRIERIADEIDRLKKLSHIDLLRKTRLMDVDFDPMDDRVDLEFLLASSIVDDDHDQLSKKRDDGTLDSTWSFFEDVYQDMKADFIDLPSRFINETTSKMTSSIPVEDVSIDGLVTEDVELPVMTSIPDDPVSDKVFYGKSINLSEEMDKIKAFARDALANSSFNPMTQLEKMSSTRTAMNHWCEKRLSDSNLRALLRSHGLASLSQADVTREELIDRLVGYIMKEAISSSDTLPHRPSISLHHGLIVHPQHKPKPPAAKRRSSPKIKVPSAFDIFEQRNIFESLLPKTSIIRSIFSKAEKAILRLTRWSCGEWISTTTATLIVAFIAMATRKGIVGYVSMMLSIRFARVIIATRKEQLDKQVS
jgi:hypothetical protein